MTCDETPCRRCGRPIFRRLSPAGTPAPGRPASYCSDTCRSSAKLNATAGPAPRPRRTRVTPFAKAVRTAIEENGISLRTLQSRLDRYGSLATSVATLSGWQNGISAPAHTEWGRNRVLALERCLGIRAGDLALLVTTNPVADGGRPLSQVANRGNIGLNSLASRHRAMQQAVNRITGWQQTIPVATIKTYRVGWNRHPVMTVITQTVRAAHDHVDRYWFVHAPSGLMHPDVGTCSGCRLGRVLPEPVRWVRTAGQQDEESVRFEAAELLFDRVLGPGEEHTFTFTVGYACEPGVSRLSEDVFRHIQVQPCPALDLTLTFAESQSPPVEVAECHWRAGTFRTLRQRVLPAGRGPYRQVIADPVPGAYGWRWTWQEPSDAISHVGR